MIPRAFRLSIVITLFIPTLVASQRPQQLGRDRPDVVANWIKRLQKADVDLQKGEWKRVKNTMNFLLREMCDGIESGEGAARMLAMAALVRGLAEAGLGNERDAIWDWHIAISLSPDLAKSDLSLYGHAGELLAAQQAALASPKTEPDEIDTKSIDSEASDHTIIPPRKIRAPVPKYPAAKKVACLEGPVIVRSIIDDHGVPKEPGIVDMQYPVMAFAALDTLREWRFTPAQLDGKPVAAYYNLTVNFNIPICRNVMATARKKKSEKSNDN